MSKTDELFGIIESPEFSATLNLASDFATFVGILGSEKAVCDLGDLMRDEAGRLAVCQRTLALAADEGQEGYEHPWDSALAAYLWLLADKDSQLANLAATRIAESPRCWWARKMSEVVRSAEKVPSSAGTTSEGP
jgi:hypothetical protein